MSAFTWEERRGALEAVGRERKQGWEGTPVQRTLAEACLAVMRGLRLQYAEAKRRLPPAQQQKEASSVEWLPLAASTTLEEMNGSSQPAKGVSSWTSGRSAACPVPSGILTPVSPCTRPSKGSSLSPSFHLCPGSHWTTVSVASSANLNFSGWNKLEAPPKPRAEGVRRLISKTRDPTAVLLPACFSLLLGSGPHPSVSPLLCNSWSGLPPESQGGTGSRIQSTGPSVLKGKELNHQW